MSYMTDETMDEFAQWQHDSAWEFEDDEFEIREGDLFECVHENGEWSDHFPMFAGKFTPYSTFECFECGETMEVAR